MEIITSFFVSECNFSSSSSTSSFSGSLGQKVENIQTFSEMFHNGKTWPNQFWSFFFFLIRMQGVQFSKAEGVPWPNLCGALSIYGSIARNRQRQQLDLSFFVPLFLFVQVTAITMLNSLYHFLIYLECVFVEFYMHTYLSILVRKMKSIFTNFFVSQINPNAADLVQMRTQSSMHGGSACSELIV